MNKASAQRAVQLTLDLPFEERLGVDDFIVSEANQFALSFLEDWPDWPAQVAILIGPTGSGKTHLGNVWADFAGAQRHRAKNLTLEIIPEWLETGCLLLEDTGPDVNDEAALFHLINTVRNSDMFLLITAEEPPQHWNIVVPDLASRLRAAIPVEIGAPDEVLLRQVFAKQFYDRQILVEPGVIDYLVSRIERSLNAVRDVVDALDRAAFSRGRGITKRLAADVLGF